MEQQIVENIAGQKLSVGTKPIKSFETEKWYVWVGGKRRRNWRPGMDFVLDSQPHQCYVGADACASFYDSSSIYVLWNWAQYLKYFRLCTPLS